MWVILVPESNGLPIADKRLLTEAEDHLMLSVGADAIVATYPHGEDRGKGTGYFKNACRLAGQPGNAGLLVVNGSRGWTAPWEAGIIMDSHLYGSFHYDTGVFSAGPAYPLELRAQLQPHFCRGIPSADERWDAAVIQLKGHTPTPEKWTALIKQQIRHWYLAAIIDRADKRETSADGSVVSRTTPKAPWGYTILFPTDSPRPDETWATLYNEVDAFDFSRIAVFGPLEGTLKDGGKLDNRFWIFDPNG